MTEKRLLYMRFHLAKCRTVAEAKAIYKELLRMSRGKRKWKLMSYVDSRITSNYLSKVLVLINNAANGDTKTLKAEVARAMPNL